MDIIRVPSITVLLVRRVDRSIGALIVDPPTPGAPFLAISLGRKRVTDIHRAKTIVAEQLGQRCKVLKFKEEG